MRLGADHQGEGLTIAAVARALGVSENAVRQRIKRGSVEAGKVDGVWRIWFDEADAPKPADQEPDHQPTTSTDRQADQEATSRSLTVSPAALAQLEAIRDQWLAPLVDRIGTLERENGRLEERLATTERERDALRAEVSQLTAGQDAPEKSPKNRGEAIAPETSTETLRENARPGPSGEATQAPETHRPSILVSAWRRLFGGG
jgi:hypothetical protein